MADSRTHTVGRSGTLQLKDPGLSRLHAEFVCDEGEWFVKDLGSTNGTYLNGERVGKRAALNPTDRVQVGATDLVVARITPDLTHDRSAPPPASRDRVGRSPHDTSSGSQTLVFEPPKLPGQPQEAPPQSPGTATRASAGVSRPTAHIPPAVWVLATLTVLTLIGLLIDVWLYPGPKI